MNVVKNNILIVISLILFSGCCALKSPVKRYECQKQRASEKIIVLTRKFPELIQPTDTIRLSDTIKTQSVEVDTSFVFDTKHDTIIVEKEKLTIRYVKTDSLIYLTGECEGDTIYIDREIPIKQIVIEQPPISKKIKEWAFVALLALIVFYFVKRKLKF